MCVRLAQQPRSDCRLLAFADPDTLHAAAQALSLPLRLLEAGQVARERRRPAPASGPQRRRRPLRRAPIRAMRARSSMPWPSLPTPACAASSMAWSPARCTRPRSTPAASPTPAPPNCSRSSAGCDVVMMLANDIVRVALATTHLPLRAVADAITADSCSSARCASPHAALRRDFGIAEPVIAVLGLNPHAGEAGHLGREEIEVIEPVLAALRARRHAPGRPAARRHRLPAAEAGAASTRCWRCTTTRACRCSSTAASSTR